MWNFFRPWQKNKEKEEELTVTAPNSSTEGTEVRSHSGNAQDRPRKKSGLTASSSESRDSVPKESASTLGTALPGESS